jgi:hypothetical protein
LLASPAVLGQAIDCESSQVRGNPCGGTAVIVVR